MPAVAEPTGRDSLPPLWGTSFWWPRAGYLLGIAAMAAGLVVAGIANKHIGPRGLPNNLTSPSIAITVAPSWDAVLTIVGPCEAPQCLESETESSCIFGDGNCLLKLFCPDKVAALRAQQSWDPLFILSYWLLFVYLAAISARFGGWNPDAGYGKWMTSFASASRALSVAAGGLIIPAVTAAAYFDLVEDRRILLALRKLDLVAGAVPGMRHFAYLKWLCIFVALGGVVPLFVFWPGRANSAPGTPRRSMLSQGLAWLTALLALSASLNGIAAWRFGEDQRLESAANGLAPALVCATISMATAQYWRGGTVNAFDKLARLWGFRFLATLFDNPSPPQVTASQNAIPQTPDIDPSRKP